MAPRQARELTKHTKHTKRPRERVRPMQSKLPAGPQPTPGQNDVTARRAGAAPRSLPPAYEDEDDPPADERPEAGLREREQVFHATFDRAVIGIAHVSPEGRWLRVNQR